MMISSPSASDPLAAAAALDRSQRSTTSQGAAAGPPSGSTPLQSDPDVVVTLSQGASPSAATYDASGRMGGAPTLDDAGANAPDSSAHASEAHADDDNAPDATSAPAATADAPVAQDAAVPA